MTNWQKVQVVAAMGIASIVILSFMLFLFNVFLPAVHITSCTVGVSGAAANMEVTGIHATDYCNIIANNPSYEVNGGEFYIMSQTQGDELCSYQEPWYGNSITITVRDSGAFELIGNEICKALYQGQFNQTT